MWPISLPVLYQYHIYTIAILVSLYMAGSAMFYNLNAQARAPWVFKNSHRAARKLYYAKYSPTTRNNLPAAKITSASYRPSLKLGASLAVSHANFKSNVLTWILYRYRARTGHTETKTKWKPLSFQFNICVCELHFRAFHNIKIKLVPSSFEIVCGPLCCCCDMYVIIPCRDGHFLTLRA